MYLTHLSLTNFRNYTRLDVEIPRGSLILVGGNAQGKTSLLEAVYFLATFVSFHASSDRQLINFLAAREPLAVARIVADLHYSERNHFSGSHRLEVRLIHEDDGLNGAPRFRKEVLLDGAKRKVGELVGTFNAVLFLPHMLRVVEGAPEERRRYLNLAMAQVIPQFGLALSEYARSLSQRNALLKQLAERGGDPQQLYYWDDQLSSLGAQIIYHRIQALRDLERLARRVHAELTRGQEVLRLDYLPSFDPLPNRPMQYTLPMDAPVDRSGISLEKIKEGFHDCLQRTHAEEIARGVTTIGPHRDDLRFLGNGIDLGIYGSRGQARTAMLSLKLAEVDWMHERSGQWPVLLLDEVLAELDPQRREDLLQRLSESEQVMLTTTDLDLFLPNFVNKASLWHIHGGRLQEDNHGTTG